MFCVSLLPFFALTSSASAAPLVIGDSLAVGMKPFLKQSINARVGRPLAEGMSIYKTNVRSITAFSLFTNDDPRNVSKLSVAVSQSLAKSDCVVWATISRPSVGGVSYARANKMLRDRDKTNKRLVVVDWSREIYRHPTLIGPDKVHPTIKGYRQRARMFQTAINECEQIVKR